MRLILCKIGETELSKYMKAYKEVDVDDDIPIVPKKMKKFCGSYS